MDNQTTLRDILETIFRCYFYILVFSLSVLVVSLVYIYMAKEVYVSKATVLNRLGAEQTPSVPSMFGQNNIYITKREQELKNEAEILVSDQVIGDVAMEILGESARDGKTLRQATRYIKSNLDVSVLYDSDMLKVLFKFPDPFVAQKILQLILNKYIAHHIKIYKNIQEVNFMENKLNESRSKYESILHEFTQFMNEFKIFDDSKQHSLLLEKRAGFQQQLADLRAEREYHRRKLERLESIKQRTPQQEIFNTTNVRNKQLDHLNTKLTEAKIERENLLLKYQSGSRLVKDIDTEIALIGEMLTKTPMRITDQQDTRTNELYKSLEAQIAQMEYEIAGEDARLDSLQNAFHDVDIQLMDYTENLKKYDMLKKELELTKKTYEKYYDGYLDFNVKNLLSQFTNLSIIEEPSLDTIPEWPKRKLLLSLMVVVLVMGNFALIIVISYLDNTFVRPVDAEKTLGSPVVGVFPMLNDVKTYARFLNLRYFKNHFNEFQRIYHHLSSDSKENVILLSKSSHGEGGTTIGYNLATFLALCHKERVAFVSFSAVKAASSGGQPGKADGGSGNGDLKTPVDIYHFPGDAGIGIEMARKASQLIEQIRSQYARVFVDLPPVGEVSDLVTFSKCTHRVLFFVEAEKAKRQTARYYLSLLNQYGFRDIGIIFNKRKFYIPAFIYRAV